MRDLVRIGGVERVLPDRRGRPDNHSRAEISRRSVHQRRQVDAAGAIDTRRRTPPVGIIVRAFVSALRSERERLAIHLNGDEHREQDEGQTHGLTIRPPNRNHKRDRRLVHVRKAPMHEFPPSIQRAFDTMNRLADAFEFFVPGPEGFEAGPKYLLARGYR